MKTDPRTACANAREKLLWAFVHDLLAHSAMALSLWSKWSLRFHDWTSHMAWPRDPVESIEVWPKPVEFFGLHEGVKFACQELRPGIWRVHHPSVNHAFTTSAEDGYKAYIKAFIWFRELSTEFGGRFRI